MLRLLGTLVIAAGAFVAGYYFGIRQQNKEILNDPEGFFREYKKDLEQTAKDKFDKILKVLSEE